MKVRGQQLPLLVHRRERPSREPLPARAGGRSIHSGTARHQADLHDAQESLQARGLSRLFITVSSPGSCGWAGLQRRPSLQLNSQAPRKPWVPASASPFRDDILSARRACSSIPRMLGTAGEERARFPPRAVLWRFVRYRWDCSRGCGEGRASRGPGFKGEYQLLEPLTFRKSKKIR